MSESELERGLRIRLEGQLEALEHVDHELAEAGALLASAQWRVDARLHELLPRIPELLPKAADARAGIEKVRARSTEAEWEFLAPRLERSAQLESALNRAGEHALRANGVWPFGMPARLGELIRLSRWELQPEPDERVIFEARATLKAFDENGKPILLGDEPGAKFIDLGERTAPWNFRGTLIMTQRRVLYADPARAFTFEIATTELRRIHSQPGENPYDVVKIGGFELTMADSSRLAWRWPPLKVFGWQEVYDEWAAQDFPAKWPPED